MKNKKNSIQKPSTVLKKLITRNENQFLKKKIFYYFVNKWYICISY